MSVLRSQTYESETTGQEPASITKEGIATYLVSTTRPFAGAKGLLVTAAGGHNYYYENTAMDVGDFEASVLINMDVATSDRPGIVFRAWNDAGVDRAYFACIRSGNTLRLGSLVDGTETSIVTPSIATLATDTWYHLKVRCVGSSIKVRYWADGSPEPETWDIDVTSTTIDNTHRGIGIYLFAGNALNLYYFDNLLVESLTSIPSVLFTMDTPETVALAGILGTTGESLQVILAKYRSISPNTSKTFQNMLNEARGLPPTAKTEQQILFENLQTALSLSLPASNYTIQELLIRAYNGGVSAATLLGI